MKKRKQLIIAWTVTLIPILWIIGHLSIGLYYRFNYIPTYAIVKSIDTMASFPNRDGGMGVRIEFTFTTKEGKPITTKSEHNWGDFTKYHEKGDTVLIGYIPFFYSYASVLNKYQLQNIKEHE